MDTDHQQHIYIGRQPILDRKGDLVGALNVTMPIGHESSEDAVSRVLPVLLETARALRHLI